MMYRIFDAQLKDYLQPYDEDKEYWTLREAQDLAYRRWEEVADKELEGEHKEYCYNQMSKMVGDADETVVAMSLQVFDYVLEEVEEEDEV